MQIALYGDDRPNIDTSSSSLRSQTAYFAGILDVLEPAVEYLV